LSVRGTPLEVEEQPVSHRALPKAQTQTSSTSTSPNEFNLDCASPKTQFYNMEVSVMSTPSPQELGCDEKEMGDVIMETAFTFAISKKGANGYLYVSHNLICPTPCDGDPCMECCQACLLRQVVC
jgi:hypothetical protein